jgi:hypothetical protein
MDRFWKNSQISNFKKIRPVGAVFFHANGQTGMLFVNTRQRLKRIKEYFESKLSCFSIFFGSILEQPVCFLLVKQVDWCVPERNYATAVSNCHTYCGYDSHHL